MHIFIFDKIIIDRPPVEDHWLFSMQNLGESMHSTSSVITSGCLLNLCYIYSVHILPLIRCSCIKDEICEPNTHSSYIISINSKHQLSTDLRITS